MLDQKTLKRNWKQVRSKVSERWNGLSTDELPSDVDELVGQIQLKTGETRDAIEAFLEDAAKQGREVAAEARERFREGAERLSESARHGAERVRQGYAEAERMVQRHPRQSMLACFGLGVACGLGIAALVSAIRHEPTALERGQRATQRFGRQLRDSVAHYKYGR